jgi:DegV family protein with EDD domain
MFDKIHEEHPEAHILYLAYSAITTCSYQSAIIASEDRDYVTSIDTKQVSAGQGLVVVAVAKYLEEHPECTVEEAINVANMYIEKARMCFMPDNLEFLRAGGRVSNAAYLGSRILNIHPCIEILDGKLTATKKYRGKMTKVASDLIKEYAVNYNLDTDGLWVIYTVGLSDEVKECIKKSLEDCGFSNVNWVLAHGVITTHGGPAAFGIAGFTK